MEFLIGMALISLVFHYYLSPLKKRLDVIEKKLGIEPEEVKSNW